MVNAQQHIVYCILFILLTIQGNAQAHLFSEVKLNKSKVYVGEPVEVSVGIYTSTWFTKGLNFGNIKVNGAFTVYFRSVTSSKKINGKNYAGVEAIYNIFPYNDKDLVFPDLEFSVETPNEGDYKGVKRIVKTKERKITVKRIPQGYKNDQWLVSSNVIVNESWGGNLSKVKVGDVIERSIFRRAYGTVAELIPPIIWDSIAGASLYPKRTEIKSDKSKTSISASRSDGVRYLFEKEGQVVLPEITIRWWNSRQKKLFKRTLSKKIVEVLPNPELGILESVRDSLLITSPVVDENDQDKPQTKIFGLSLKTFVSYVLIGLLILYIIFKFLRWLIITKGILDKIKSRNQAYLNSEIFYFKNFLKQASRNNKTASLNAMYQWIDRLELAEPTLKYFALNYGSKEFIDEMIEAENNAYLDPSLLRNHIKTARKRYLKKGKEQSNKTFTQWINP